MYIKKKNYNIIDILPKLKYFEYKKNIKSNIIFHIPHNEIRIPIFAKKDYLISKEQIIKEAILLADWRVLELIKNEIKKKSYLKFNYSRIFLDVERFKSGNDIMDLVGMGMIYSNGYLNKNFRQISKKDKGKIGKIYDKYHQKLFEISKSVKKKFGEKSIILDIHSFPDENRWYENNNKKKPDICIGINNRMKESKIAKWMKYEFEKKGFKVLINSPFTGSMVPSGLKIDSVMIEINRKLYLDGNYNYIGNKKLEIVLKEIIEKISV